MRALDHSARMPDQVLVCSRFSKKLLARIGERFELLDTYGAPPQEAFSAAQLAPIRALITAGGQPLGADVMDVMPALRRDRLLRHRL